MHDVFKSFSDSGWRYIIPPQWKNRQVVSQMYQVRPVTGENRKHWAVTLYYQRNISWPALDGLMIDHCSFIFQSGQVPTNTTKKKECLSDEWPWLSGPKLFQMGQRLTDLVKVASRGLIEKLKALWAFSVKCSPVSHTDTLMFALSTIGSSAVALKKTNLLSARKKKKKLSPCLVLCSQPELDEYSHGENTSGMQHQQRCLASCIYWVFVIVASFFFFSLVTGTNMTAFIYAQDTDDHALHLVSTQLCDKCTWSTWLLFCIRTACLCVMCLLLWKGRRLAVCLLPSSWNLSVPLGSWAQVYRTAEAALTARLISFGARHAALPLAAWTGFVPFLPLYIHKLYI